MKEKAIKFCQGVIDFSIFSIILLIPIFFSFFSESWNAFELPKMVAFRFLLSIGVLAWLAKTFLLKSFSIRFSWPLFILSTGLLLSFLLSTIFSIHPFTSFWGKYHRLQGFSSFLSYYIFFWLCFFEIRTQEKIKRCLLAVVLSSLAVCFYGALQFLYLDPFKWAEPFSISKRIFSSIGQPNFLGHYLVVVMPITVFWLVFVSKRLLWRVLLLVLLILQMACLYYTWSRSAWLAFMTQSWFFVLFFLWLKKRGLFKIFLAISVLVVLSLATLFLIPKNNDSNFWMKNRWISSFNLDVGTGKTRMLYWSGATKQFLEASLGRKMFGYGQDVLPSITIKWYEPEWANSEKLNLWPDRMHNFFFDALMSTGLASVLLSVVMIFFFVYFFIITLRKREKSFDYFLATALMISFVGYFINNLLSFSLITLFVYFYFFLSLLAGIVIPCKDKKINFSITASSRVFIFLAMVFFVAVFVFYKGMMSLRADSYFMETRNAERRSNCEALQVNRLATVANPYESVYREEYIYNALNCLEVMTDMEEKKILMDNIDLTFLSISEKEMNYYLSIERANTLSVKAFHIDNSYYEEAENAFKDLLFKHPNVSQVYFYYGFHKLRFGEYDAVLELVAKADAMLPQLKLPIYFLDNAQRQAVAEERVRFYDLAASASERKGDLDSAADFYLKAVRANPYRLVDYKRRGDMYYLKGQIDDAITCNQRGYSLSSKDYSWPLAISLLYDSKGDGVGAVEYARQTLALEENATSALKILEKYGHTK